MDIGNSVIFDGMEEEITKEENIMFQEWKSSLDMSDGEMYDYLDTIHAYVSFAKYYKTKIDEAVL